MMQIKQSTRPPTDIMITVFLLPVAAATAPRARKRSMVRTKKMIKAIMCGSIGSIMVIKLAPSVAFSPDRSAERSSLMISKAENS